MSRFKVGASAVFALVIGCHSRPIKTNDPSQPKAVQWQNEYRAARQNAAVDSKGSCAVFRRLAAEKDFPPHDVADLRAWEICGDRNLKTFDRAHYPSYLQNLALDVALGLARSSADTRAEMTLAIEKSKAKAPQAERLRWLELASTRARELKDQTTLEQIAGLKEKVAPRFLRAPTDKDFLSVAADFRLNREFPKAREFYEKVLASSVSTTDDKVSALKGLRLSYKNARQGDAHLGAGDRLSKFLGQAVKGSPRSRALRLADYDAKLYQGRALWTAGRASEARALLERVETTSKSVAKKDSAAKTRVSLAELYWLRARMADEEHDFAAVHRWLELALAEKNAGRPLRDKILWYDAWNERRRGQLARAAELLSQLDQETRDDFVRHRVLYWRGVTLREDDRDAEAKQTFQRLIELDPIGYYGLLAHRAVDVPLQLKVAREVGTPPSDLPVDLSLSEWLNRLDEKDLLTAMLDEGAQKYRASNHQQDDGWFALFKLYAKAGLFSKLFDRLGTLTPERRQALLGAHPELLFPQPWKGEVDAASARFQVTPELIYAIMRQESAFDPRARSGADAFGLLQVLPEVAEPLARANQIPYVAMEDLFNPAVDIPIGAAHLRQLLTRYRGQFILAAAAYNASDAAIRNWLKTHYRGDALEFIEEIPFEETRAYVRLVMRNMIFYALLRGGQPSMAFPEDLLRLSAHE